MSTTDWVRIFDTTLRDGEQSPGCSMNLEEKVQMALQLKDLRINILEAGFPVASPSELDSVRTIAALFKEDPEVTVAGLARCGVLDIDAAWDGVAPAASKRIHVFIATSPLHMEVKLKKKPIEVLKQAEEMVAYAVSKFGKGGPVDVEFSAEDATRSEREFLKEIFTRVIKAGATTINVPDTVGYTTPQEIYDLFDWLIGNVPGADKVIWSSHCHNDLGLAVANSLAAVQAGARQVECTMNGIGERAGNASLEEIIMAMKVRNNIYPYWTTIENTKLLPTSRKLSHLTGMLVQRNKAIVGENAFAHESGIHQHGVLANALTYEIMTPESVGRTGDNNLVLGKHSGRAGLKSRLEQLGYTVDDEALSGVYERFLALCDRKKTIYDEDLTRLMQGHLTQDVKPKYELLHLQVTCGGQNVVPTAYVRLNTPEGEKEGSGFGDGPVDAAMSVIRDLTHFGGKLVEFRINAVTQGRDALGDSFVKVQFEKALISGKSSSTDIVDAAVRAYLDALNKYLALQDMGGVEKLHPQAIWEEASGV